LPFYVLVDNSLLSIAIDWNFFPFSAASERSIKRHILSQLDRFNIYVTKIGWEKPEVAFIKNNQFEIRIEIYNWRSEGAGNQNANSIIIFDWMKTRISFFKC